MGYNKKNDPKFNNSLDKSNALIRYDVSSCKLTNYCLGQPKGSFFNSYNIEVYWIIPLTLDPYLIMLSV